MADKLIELQILGKQELHLEAEVLDWYVRNISNVIISVNLEHKELNPPQQKIIQRDGVGVAILGYTSESVEMINTNTIFHVKNVIQSLNEKIREITLVYSRVRLFVVAGCAGLESAKEIALRTSSIRVIFSSCSRNLMWHDDNPPKHAYKYGPYPLKINNRDGHEVLICHVFGTNQYLGMLEVTLDEKQKIQSYNGEVMHVNLSLPEDPEIADIVKDEAEAPDVLTGKVGKARVFLDGSCTKSECNLGNMVADSFVQYASDSYTGSYWTDAPIAIVPGNIIRGNINTTMHKGRILAEDVSSVIEDIFELVTFEVTGEDLYRCFEYAIDIQHKHAGERFLQVSGIRLVYDNRRPAGNRIVRLNARCAYCDIPTYEPVKRKALYNVTSMVSLPFEEYNFGTEIVKHFVMHNTSNFEAVLSYINHRKFIAASINDRIIQEPLHSSIDIGFPKTIVVTFQLIIAMLVIVTKITSEDVTFTILHTGDTHANFDQDSKGIGGVGRIVTYVKKQRELENATIYLDTGDIFTGSIWFSIHRINIAIDFAKLMNADVVALGNHEFDEGIEQLGKYLAAVKVPLVCANANVRGESVLQEYIKPSIVLNVAGVKVGVIGYINQHVGGLAPIGKIVVEDEQSAIRREIGKLKAQGVNIIIGLGHSGYGVDQILAANIDDLDIIVGGHTHTFLYNSEPPIPKLIPKGNYPTIVKNPIGRKIPIVHGYAFAKFIGKLKVTFDDKGLLRNFSGEPILLDSSIEPDPEAINILNRYRPAIEALKRQVLGQSRVHLTGGCRFEECNLGNLLLDAFIHFKCEEYEGPYWSNVAVALINGGSIRRSISPDPIDGNITTADVYGAIPFDNILVTMEINGSTFLDALEYSEFIFCTTLKKSPGSALKR
ncbi:hypothetical protein Trydic_g3510 [Trypoxylus dichotomus]